jgi:flagellar biogenesis protein FliO
LNFDFWKSAIFYISLVLTILWILLLIWGWRKDVSDMRKEKESQEVKSKKN